ncbi:hypothetical protein [Paraburkholderia youngii]|uniref:Uncharacterized protein n=1 Tax=Paraburkholderia youngii TaxID=2782701 RepID=A0A7W8L4W9_9BURK|nr:hypothetical protein [Paraburkholderia youngii]MBB5400535.1 hypothetical protein [Paraburkholderia youngii]
MSSTIYLGLEGTLFARRCPVRLSRSRLEHPGALPLPLLHRLSRIADEYPDLTIVINSWLVADYGYRGVLNLLPASIANKTVGATMQGNRAHRRLPTLPRVEILRADIKRRNPAHLIIVDSCSSAIPYEYLPQAVLVNDSSELAATQNAEIILEILDCANRAQSLDQLAL